MDKQQLADFLRVRRAALQPADVGLPDGQRRRTPGLRRQEVAQLAGMSVEYLIRLEQARGPKPSKQVLGALARALMLDRDQRAHLYYLAGESPEPTAPSSEVPRTVMNLLAGLSDFPAYAVNTAYDILAWNRLCAEFMVFLDDMAPEQRNILRQSFTGPASAEYLAQPEHQAFLRDCVADVRASLACNPKDDHLRELVDELLRSSPEFGEMWSDYEVRVRRVMTKAVVHPVAGPMEVDCQVLEVPEAQMRIIFYVPEPDSSSAEAMAALAERAAAARD